MIIEALTDGSGNPNRWPCRMAILGQSEARRLAPEIAPSHVLTIKSAATRYFGPTGIPEDRHLIVVFEDTIDPDHEECPGPEHLDRIQAWTDALPQDATLILHGLQGLGRSTAVALGLLARQVPPLLAGALLHRIRPAANPNRLIVRMWDDRLGLDGELVRISRNFPCEVWRDRERESKPPARRTKPTPAQLRSRAS